MKRPLPFLAALLVAGCSGAAPAASPSEVTPAADLSPAEEPTPEISAPTEEPESAEAPFPVIFEADFSSPVEGLFSEGDSRQESGPRGTIDNHYTDQETLSLSAELLPDQGFELGTIGQTTRGVVASDGRDLGDLADVSVEAHATLVDWETGAVWGILCRAQPGDDDAGYEVALNVDENGLEADIWRVTGDEATLEQLAHAAELPSSVTVEEREWNYLRVDCIGDTITMYVDDEKILEATDGFYQSGAVGVFITPFVPREIPDQIGAKATAEFDNLRISAPASDS